MDGKFAYSLKDGDRLDAAAYHGAILSIQEFFFNNGQMLSRVRDLARKIKDGFDAISPVIEEVTKSVCPHCSQVCCINRHGFHNYEDLVYLSALGVKPPPCELQSNDTDPCSFLKQNGCSLERWVRPSGCNWYFCDSLLDLIEEGPEYHRFDDCMRDLAELWMEMMEEFLKTSPPRPA